MPDNNPAVTVEDVPYCHRPLAVYVVTAVATLFWAVVLFLVPALRPTVVEAAVAVSMGFVAGRLLSRYWTAYLDEVTERCRKDPDVKVWACLVRGPYYSQNNASYFLVELLVVFGGVAAISLLLAGWAFLVTGLQVQRLTCNGEQALIRSLLPAVPIYLLTLWFVVAWYTLRWYRRLV